MKHEVTRTEDRTIIALHGEIDLESSPEARELLLGSVAGGKSLLVVNTSEIDFVHRKADLDDLESQIRNMNRGVQYYSPLGTEKGTR